jgi:ATP adenylyltransferase/5',5'''-P-1,P-4-tetraphosphate phosphorylase II
MASKKGAQPKNAAEKADSLGNIDQSLVLMNNFQQDYVLALNKFPVVDHHALIITREFIDQDTYLTSKDFMAFWTG